MGRRSYEELAPVWPAMEDFARYNAMPEHVVSTTSTNPTWHSTTVLKNLGEVAILKRKDGGPVIVDGGAAEGSVHAPEPTGRCQPWLSRTGRSGTPCASPKARRSCGGPCGAGNAIATTTTAPAAGGATDTTGAGGTGGATGTGASAPAVPAAATPAAGGGV